MEFKGTQGNWTVKDNFREPNILNEDNCVIFTHNKDCNDIDEDLIKYYSHNKMMANVKLAAAAPDLLKALIKVEKIYSDIERLVDGEVKEMLEQTREAINKALN